MFRRKRSADDFADEIVLVQREMETGRSLLASIAISRARLDDTA